MHHWVSKAFSLISLMSKVESALMCTNVYLPSLNMAPFKFRVYFMTTVLAACCCVLLQNHKVTLIQSLSCCARPNSPNFGISRNLSDDGMISREMQRKKGSNGRLVNDSIESQTCSVPFRRLPPANHPRECLHSCHSIIFVSQRQKFDLSLAAGPTGTLNSLPARFIAQIWLRWARKGKKVRPGVDYGELAADITRARVFNLLSFPLGGGSQTRSTIRKPTLAICWNTYVRIYTTVMPLKHAESRAIQPLFRRYHVCRCPPLFPSFLPSIVVVVVVVIVVVATKVAGLSKI